jgi:predicted Zn-ribbon and HTH transcriptional regulator
MTTEAIEEERLQQCPGCGYSLFGLGVERRCPECGLTIDRRWRVFGGRSVWQKCERRTRILQLLTALSMTAFWVWVTDVTSRRQQGLGAVLLPTAFISALALGVWLVIWRPGAFVAIGPRRLAVGRKPGRIEEYSWSRIGRVRYAPLSRSVIVVVDGRRVRLSGFWFFRDDRAEAKRCAVCVSESCRRVRSTAATPTRLLGGRGSGSGLS